MTFGVTGRGALLALAMTAAAAAPAQGAPRDAPAPEAVPGEYLVTFAPGVRGAERAAAVRERGGRALDRIAALDTTLVEFRGDARAAAARAKADARFASVEPNLVYRTLATPNDPGYAQQWGFPKISAPAAWDTTQGAGTTVIAVVDTGVQRSHPDLDAKIVAGYDFVQSDTAPDDGNGHGTHVAGSAAAETGNATGGAGTCPGCKVMPVRVLDDSGSGTLANVAKGITYAADHGAKVINLSLGGGGTSTLQDAVDYAAGKGVFLACAAGNSNTSSTTSAYPAAYANCYAVASTTETDARSSFSNYGSWVEVAAPGSNIHSTWIGSSSKTISGTSMATPHVAGLAGLLASQGLTAAQARDRICQTADKIAGTGSTWTCGRIDAEAAVTAGTSTPPPSTSTAIVNGGFEDGTSPWAQSSSGGYQLISSTRPRTGAYSAYLGDYNYATESISQTVTVPASGVLKYWWYMSTAEWKSKVYDRLRVRVLSSTGSVLATLRTWSNTSGEGRWREDSLALGSWAGRTVRVEFLVTTDAANATAFWVDDVSLGS